MRSFHSRISAAESSEIFQAARRSGAFDDEMTSFLVHDLGRMRERFEILQAIFPADTLHALAIKANPLVRVLAVAAEHGMGLEAASMEEVYLAVAAGCPAERIVFDSPAKTVAEIREALELGVMVNANSLDELERIDAIIRRQPSKSMIGLRVNPEVGSGAIEITSVASSTSKFGVSLRSSREQVIDSFVRYDWLRGLHLHVGSQGCALEMLTEAASMVDQLRVDIETRLDRKIGFVDIGGGLPAVYGADQSVFTPAEYVEQLRERAGGLMDGSTPLVTEFGRAIQAGCGLTFSRVEYVRPEQSMIVIHVGADLLVRPVYASKDWKHEFLVLTAEGEVKQGEAKPTTIAGPLCFSGDIIGRELLLPEVQQGDWIVIRDTGAYTLSMWSRHCSRSIPIVLGYDPQANDPISVLRNPETPTSIVNFWR